ICSVAHRAPPSFPTRRSSDLKQLVERRLLKADFNYRSGYCEYEYEMRAIGRLANLMHKANYKDWVDVDDFFRRLRMIDVPGLYPGPKSPRLESPPLPIPSSLF